MSRTSADPGGILSGIRVVDFGRYIAGPYCASLLADFGADVIRVEPPEGSDDRNIVPVAEAGDGALFLQVNRNKRAMALDLGKPGSERIVARLVAASDVVVMNVPHPALVKMGLDYETLRGVRPDLVFVNVSCFGSVGPWSDRPGFDSIGQAMSGSSFLTGEGATPFRTPITWVDHATGLYAAIGVLLALMDRERTGRGQEVEASLLGSALATGSTMLIEEMLAGPGRSAIGNRSFSNGPTDLFRTSDGWIVTQVVGNALFRRWSALVGQPDLIRDPRFGDDQSRGDNGEILSEMMSLWCAGRTTEQALDALAAARVPAGPVLSPSETVRHGQVRAMGLIRPTPIEGLDREAPLFSPPIKMGGEFASIRLPPPRVGQHTAAILSEIGFSEAEQAMIRREGLV